jgi:hypothetical protein
MDSTLLSGANAYMPIIRHKQSSSKACAEELKVWRRRSLKYRLECYKKSMTCRTWAHNIDANGPCVELLPLGIHRSATGPAEARAAALRVLTRYIPSQKLVPSGLNFCYLGPNSGQKPDLCGQGPKVWRRRSPK